MELARTDKSPKQRVQDSRFFMFDFSRATDAYRSKSQIAYVTTSVSMAFKPIPFSDDYQPKGNFILEELWKHLLEVRAKS